MSAKVSEIDSLWSNYLYTLHPSIKGCSVAAKIIYNPFFPQKEGKILHICIVAKIEILINIVLSLCPCSQRVCINTNLQFRRLSQFDPLKYSGDFSEEYILSNV